MRSGPRAWSPSRRGTRSSPSATACSTCSTGRRTACPRSPRRCGTAWTPPTSSTGSPCSPSGSASGPTTSPWWQSGEPRERPAPRAAPGRGRPPLGDPGAGRPDPGQRRELPGLAVAGLGQLGRLVARRPAGAGRDLQPGGRVLLRRDRVAHPPAARGPAAPRARAEPYSRGAAFFSAGTGGRTRRRPVAPPPPPDATVDVFVTAYDEPVELLMTTARAARDITYPHRTWVLDDGARPAVREAALAAGVGYLTRSTDWAGMPRHAKAGNLNNALLATDGEFLLVLDADQVPHPTILDRTLGWFDDPRVALVQTPQWFVNVDDDDVLGSQAPLFYGPLQQGKDGWNAAYFCGSNAVLRREALMQLGVVGYVRAVEQAIRRALGTAGRVIAAARKEAAAAGPVVQEALDQVAGAVRQARAEVAAGDPVSEVTYRFQQRVNEAGRGVVSDDLARMEADLAEIANLVPHGGEAVATELDGAVLTRLAGRDWSPIAALESVKALVVAVDVELAGEAQPVMPLATISVTEDMATSMRLHGMGWRTVSRREVLARGLAPQDLGAMLQQRLRWSQGTLQVALKENPLVQRGLSVGQRLMYLATMWSYLAGFAAVVYIAAPVAYLFLGVRPVTSYGDAFLLHLVP